MTHQWADDFFQFPQAQFTALPNPYKFFSTSLSAPFPTNSFFQNFVLKNGDQPEYIHPYLIKSSQSSLSISYPSQFISPSSICQVFNADLTISALRKTKPDLGRHVISSYSDLSVTLDITDSNLQFFLVRGSPYVTASVNEPTPLSISTIHSILSFSFNDSLTKYTIRLNNGQIWLIYSSSPIKFSITFSEIISGVFSGLIRVAVLPENNLSSEAILDKFSSCYPVSGDAAFTGIFTVKYNWTRKGCGDLLMLAHPLHLQRLSKKDSNIIVLDDFKYRSIDGDLVGLVGDSWVLKSHPICIPLHSTRIMEEESHPEIISALRRDVESLNSSAITTNSSYYHGKLIARAARLALIAEERSLRELLPRIEQFLKETIEPWLDGTLVGNGFLYDGKWGGIVTSDLADDIQFSIYHNHHYHLGYFLYGIAVLAHMNLIWGRMYKPQVYSLLNDYMNLERKSSSIYPRLRCFDFYKLHSWAGGLTEFANGRYQQSSSEAVNSYYSAALLGNVYGDLDLMFIGSTLTSFEIHAAKTWCQVKLQSKMYGEDFTKNNSAVAVLWSNKRDSGQWFAPADWRECNLSNQVLPLSPITEVLFSNVSYVKQLVKWTRPTLHMDKWKGFAYALEAIYDKKSALEKTRSLEEFDESNSLTNLLWWIHSGGA